MPKPPTSWFRFVQVEPAPDTVAVPCEPGALPTNPARSVNVPPFWMISVPELPAEDPRFMVVTTLSVPRTSTVPLPPAVRPRVRLLATASLVTTCAVAPLLMAASSVAVGAVGGNGKRGSQLKGPAQLPKLG